MHFNDLIIRLRIQALGGVAALSTLLGIFGKSGTEPKTSWEMAAGLFGFLCLLWIAIWILDFCYYNRLLLGAVKALTDLEERSKSNGRIRSINLSTDIEAAVARRFLPQKWSTHWRRAFGRWAFYIIVLVALIGGVLLSLREYQSL